MTVLSLDLETYSDEDLPKTGVYRYAESPVFEVTLLAYAYDDQEVHIVDLLQGEKIPDQVLRDLTDPSVIKTAFNAAFERTCLAAYLGKYMPPEQWRCTSVLALTLGLPGNLGAVGDAMRLGKDKKKMGVGRSLISYFCKPCKPTKVNGQRTRNFPHHDPDRWELFKTYCKQDVTSEREIRNRLLVFDVTPKEQALWCLDQRINERGAPLDMQLVEHAIRCDAIYAERLLAEAIEITGLKNPKSVAQLKKWLRDVDDIDVESLNKQVVPELLRGTTNDSVRRVLQLRQEMAKSSVSKYKAMARAVSKDGRVRGLHQFYGANRTGRWAGRVVQTQNLPQNKLKDLDLARNLLREGKYDELEMMFGNVPDTLSQLIRTAIIASPGRQLMVVDFSAIEARVLAWLAWEEWRIRVFNTHGMIYEASAAEMFHVDIRSIQYVTEDGEKIKGPNFGMRQKGKVGELALGYQGGAGALITMGALKMGLEENELDPIKVAWRAANKKIEQFWYDVERAATRAIVEKQPVLLPIADKRAALVFSYEKGCLFIKLPSGRRLCYYRARMEHDVMFNKTVITYGGLDQKTKQWSDNIRTYGGKLVENCIAKGTLVFTNRGWIPIEGVSSLDLVHDGVEFVAHGGTVFKSVQACVKIDGVYMTPDHEVLTNDGWQTASQQPRPYRPNLWGVDRDQSRPYRWEKMALAFSMRMRKVLHQAWRRCYEGAETRRQTELRVSDQNAYQQKQHPPRHEQAPSFCSMAQHARPVPVTDTPSVEKLRRPWRNRMLSVARVLREFLGGYGTYLHPGLRSEPQGQQRAVFTGELRVDYPSAQLHEQAQHRTAGGCSGFEQSYWDSHFDYLLPISAQVAGGQTDLDAKCKKPVYDILNAGPRRRFVVKGIDGPFIVHNCTQAIARDCLREGLFALDVAGFETIMHIHDEAVSDGGNLAQAEAIMGTPIPWAPELPLRGDGFVTPYYKKDD